MPGKTKNRRIKGNRRRRKGTRSQRGGDWMNTFSFGLAGTPDEPTTTSSSSWSDWWNKLTLPNSTVVDSNTNPMQPPANTLINESSLSNSDFGPVETTSNPIQSAQYNGGKKSKSKSCSRKHKHRKSCKK